MHITIRFEPLKEGAYLETNNALQRSVLQRRTVAEMVKITQDFACKPIESCGEQGNPLLLKVNAT